MKSRSCSGFQKSYFSRRDAMRIGSVGGLGLSLGQMLKIEAAQKNYKSVEGTAKSVIQIRLGGGVSAQESWNPKPDAPGNTVGLSGW